MGPYRVAASSAHSGVDSGRVGTKIASGASRAVLKPSTSFQMAKCGAGERQDRVVAVIHTSCTILYFTKKHKFIVLMILPASALFMEDF